MFLITCIVSFLLKIIITFWEVSVRVGLDEQLLGAHWISVTMSESLVRTHAILKALRKGCHSGQKCLFFLANPWTWPGTKRKSVFLGSDPCVRFEKLVFFMKLKIQESRVRGPVSCKAVHALTTAMLEIDTSVNWIPARWMPSFGEIVVRICK